MQCALNASPHNCSRYHLHVTIRHSRELLRTTFRTPAAFSDKLPALWTVLSVRGNKCLRPVCAMPGQFHCVTAGAEDDGSLAVVSELTVAEAVWLKSVQVGIDLCCGRPHALESDASNAARQVLQ